MKSIVGRSARVGIVLLVSLIIFSAQPSIAETIFSHFQPDNEESKQGSFTSLGKLASEEVKSDPLAEEKGLAPASHYVATAYSLRGRTASGRMVSKGLIAADPRLLPLGSRVRLEAGGYSGEYLVADTGGAIRGRRIDIWTPSSSEAMRFGRRAVKLTVLSYPVKRGKRLTKG
jgi:3D (Asp-Asp-Asp) domain-containing protein